MSKVSFRARQIDFNKPLPIIKNDSDLLSEINESTLVSRGVPQIPSGMEKEEENEHHFVEVIHALQLRDASCIKIPVPDIVDSDLYHQTYPNEFSLPKQLVHIRTTLLSEDNDADYDMDSEDEEWLSKSRLGIEAEKFESMIDRLERGCGQRVMNLEEAKCLLQDDPSLVIAVYDYWLSKRVQCRQPLLFSVRQEKRDNCSNTDPYVAFRRRSEKMQTRKNRKNDEQSYEKMLILRNQMDILGDILSRLIKREVVKESLLQCERQTFDTRYQLRDWDGTHIFEAEIQSKKRSNEGLLESPTMKTVGKRTSRKRKATQRSWDSSRTHSSEDVSDVDQSLRKNLSFAFLRTQGCRYLRPRTVHDVEESSMVRHPHLRYSLTTVPVVCHPVQHTYTGYIRRRLGRGGRIVCDRLQAPVGLNSFLRRANHNTPDYMRPCHAPIESFDETLARRLKPVVLGNRRSRPCLRWPLCTKFPSPSFEVLHRPPWKGSPATSSVVCCPSPMYILEHPATLSSSNRSPTPELEKSGSLKSSDLGCSSKDSSHPIIENEIMDTLEFQNQTSRWFPKNMVSVPGKSPLGGSLACLPPSNTDCAKSLWHQATRKYGSFDGLRTSDHSKTHDPEVTKVNGLAARIPQSSDDRLLRKDSSVLSSKLYCITRDCGSMDSSVPGPQLQTTNGMSSTQFCQLPT